MPFGTQAALNALDLTESLRWLHGSLAVALRQALFLGERKPTAGGIIDILDELSTVIAPVDSDRPLDADVHMAADRLDTIADKWQADTSDPPPPTTN